jgi:hypothetical protein
MASKSAGPLQTLDKGRERRRRPLGTAARRATQPSGRTLRAG